MFKEAIIRPPSFTNHSEVIEWIHHNIPMTGHKQYSLTIGIFDE